MRAPVLVLAMSPADSGDFLPPDVMGRLLALPFRFRDIAVVSALDDPVRWRAQLAESRCEVLVSCWSTPALPADLAVGERAEGLRYVCHLAGSLRRQIPRALLERGLRVSNWGGSISRTVAESVLLLILSALRRSAQWAVALHRDGAWKTRAARTQSLFGRRVGIHGFGMVARCLVPLLRPFGVAISAHAPEVGDEHFDGLGVRRCSSLEELFAGSDVVVGLAPGTPENLHVVTTSLLRSIPAGGVFVNAGRGATVGDETVLRVAREGQLQIALDVYETEPLPADSPLRGLPNVTLSPHLGGPTVDRRRDAGEFAVQNLERYLQGRPLEAEMTLDIYDRAS